MMRCFLALPRAGHIKQLYIPYILKYLKIYHIITEMNFNPSFLVNKEKELIPLDWSNNTVYASGDAELIEVLLLNMSNTTIDGACFNHSVKKKSFLFLL